jgi:hypothetical protein
MTRGRPLRGFFGGLFLGVCIDLDLIFGGVVKLQTPLLTILPVVLTVVFLALGLWAPIGRPRQMPGGGTAPLPSALPRPVTWPEYAPTEGSTASSSPAPPRPDPEKDLPPTSSI